MSDRIIAVVGFTMTLLVGVIIGIAVAEVSDSAMQREAIKRGFAEYNSTNGNWQWREKQTNVVTVFREVWETNMLFVPTNTYPIYHWTTNDSLGGVITLNGGGE